MTSSCEKCRCRFSILQAGFNGSMQSLCEINKVLIQVLSSSILQDSLMVIMIIKNQINQQLINPWFGTHVAF